MADAAAASLLSVAAARNTMAGSSAAAATTAAGAAASARSSSSNAAASTSAARAATSSAAAAVASSSTSAASSSAAAASTSTSSSISSSISSIASSSSSIASSSSSSGALSSSSLTSSASSIATALAGSSSTVSSSGGGLSGGAIGGIAGGVVGGLLLLALLWTCWRRSRERGPKVLPPPPRDMAYNPQSLGRQRVPSGNMLPTSSMNRASSYSTLLHKRPSSTFNAQSRQPSYYATYPVATPSTVSHDASPPMPSSTSSGSPPLSAQETGSNTPMKKSSLTPITTDLRRDDSSSSGEQIMMARHKTSVDRLRAQPAERVPSPSSAHFPTPVPSEAGGSSRTNSPHPSSLGHSSRQSGLSPGHTRPYSMTSISSSRHLLTGPYGGAPHSGRPVQLEMPRLLGARPDQNGDFFWGSPRPTEGFSMGTADSRGGHQRISSGALTDRGTGSSSPARTRISSSQAVSGQPNSNSGP